jgi:5-formyltetrahydrofolate cyclo-ligase
MPKHALRQRLLTAREQLSAEYCEQAASLITATLVAHPAYQAASSVALYMAVKNEVPTADLIAHARLTGKAVLLPVVNGGSMFFRETTDNDELLPGAFGIREPHDSCPVRDPADIDLFIIPGVAFDLQGLRIGFGKGYYDRVLHRLEGSGRFVGICYDFQLVDAIVGEPHDVIMDMVITERRAVTPVLRK